MRRIFLLAKDVRIAQAQFECRDPIDEVAYVAIGQ